jgi:hypothetical protein
MCETCDSYSSNDCIEDCNDIWGGDASIDNCSYCTCGSNGTYEDASDCLIQNVCVEDCNGDWGGSAEEDMCETCDSYSSNDCIEDCNDIWGGDAANDSCGVCSGGTSDHEADSDQDECGVCDGDNSTCTDCDGVVNGNAYIDPHFGIDDCNTGCVGGNTNLTECTQDCAGLWDGDSWKSDCGCVPVDNLGNDCDDCAGVPNGNNLEDNCGTCDNDPGNDCVDDCAGVPGGDAVEDECGVCGGNNSSCADCAGVPNGDSWESDCGCVAGDNDGNDCDDCAGLPNGTAEMETYYLDFDQDDMGAGAGFTTCNDIEYTGWVTNVILIIIICYPTCIFNIITCSKTCTCTHIILIKI